eukprot:scaffold3016_cov114-Skeletonema_dohrnii-CCMP3373.AAC.7
MENLEVEVVRRVDDVEQTSGPPYNSRRVFNPVREKCCQAYERSERNNEDVVDDPTLLQGYRVRAKGNDYSLMHGI